MGMDMKVNVGINMTRTLLTLLTITAFFFDIFVCQENLISGKRLENLVLHNIINDYGSEGRLTYEQIEKLVEVNKIDVPRDGLKHEVMRTFHNSTCLKSRGDSSSDECLLYDGQCLTVKNLFELYEIHITSFVNETMLQEMAPTLLYLFTQNCTNNVEHHETDNPPSSLSVWGYGFLFVTLINLCSLVGVIVLPFMKMAAYKEILIFMVALAVGALAGSGLLFLIPEAFGLVTEDEEANRMYIYKASTVMGGIYLFYLTEKIMRIVTHWKERRNQRLRNKNCDNVLHDNDEDKDSKPGIMDIICSVKNRTPMNQEQIYKEPASFPNMTCTGSQLQQQRELLEKSSDDSTYGQDNVAIDDVSNVEERSVSGTRNTVKPLAWMIIFGDGLHNFIDGLSIGTAFTQSTLAGISVSVAVMCEELPHELGDFAILLNCGMTVRRALMYNFLSACMCYLGLIIGTLLGENTASHDWVFAIAGGMFLYISLADMMPEMNSASEAQNGQKHGTGMVFLLQNLGLLTGFGIMFVLALFGGNINFE